MNAPLPAYYNFPRPEIVAMLEPKGARILDVGCAAGAMGARLLAGGALEVVGLEREPRAALIARTRLSAVYQYDLNELPALPYPDGYFDAITCADVLEHLVDPGALLKELRRYLKHDGLLVCSIPNIRHESVLVPLVVDGLFSYVDAGILDRTHLRFFTIKEIASFLLGAGFSMDEQVDAVGSQPSPSVAKLAELVGNLGGDAKAFEAEASVIQYLVRAKPVASSEKQGEPSKEVPRGALANPWAGSRPARVLLAPDLADPEDNWLTVLTELTADPHRASQMTIGLAVERQALEAPPKAFEEFARKGACDLLLTEAPNEPFAWERLCAGATVFVDTARRESLAAIARRVGLEVHESSAKKRPDDAPGVELYLDLMKRALLNTLYEDGAMKGSQPFEASKREVGLDWPSLAHTMIGRKRLDNLQWCVDTALKEGVPGDFIETGVWRGGACILMRAVLKARGIHDRRVFVADSFAGLPPPNAAEYPADANDAHHTFSELAVSLEQVKANFGRYGLLDEQVVFLKGWFKDTLPGAPIQKLAVARLDGDMYESTMDALKALYPKLSSGGFLIVDDYGAVPACRQAIEDYRRANGIDEPVRQIDWTGVYWRKR